ncbi:MAG: PRC-barrel domain-containing protein [bacterium]|nr:PRC-barrel domain-containing protein [bacterium]
MQVKHGAVVLTADGERLGRVKSVVMTPRTQEITDLVIERGFLFTEERVLPIRWIARTDDDGNLILNDGEGQIDQLPRFEESQYISDEDLSEYQRIEYGAQGEPTPDTVSGAVPPAYYFYGTPGVFPPYYSFFGYPDMGAGALPRYTAMPDAAGADAGGVQTVQNIPDGTVALPIGAEVISRDGERVGTLERLFTSQHEDRVSHILISQGLLGQTRKLIPTDWIHTVDAHVHLNVPTRLVERLETYNGD